MTTQWFWIWIDIYWNLAYRYLSHQTYVKCPICEIDYLPIKLSNAKGRSKNKEVDEEHRPSNRVQLEKWDAWESRLIPVEVLGSVNTINIISNRENCWNFDWLLSLTLCYMGWNNITLWVAGWTFVFNHYRILHCLRSVLC